MSEEDFSCESCQDKSCLKTKIPCRRIERILRNEGVMPDKWIIKHYRPQNSEDLVRIEHIVQGLIKNRFCDELLSNDFRYCLEHMLSMQERQIIELLIEGYTPEKICKLMGLSDRGFACSKNKAKSKILIFLKA